MRSLFVAGLVSLSLLVALLAPCVCHANGRFPAAGQLVIDPHRRERLMVRATYGFLVSDDAGTSWSWLCEQAIGYQGLEDPMVAITADGTHLAALVRGLSVSRDGCAFQVEASLGDASAVDLAVDPARPSRVLVLASRVGADDVRQTRVWESLDDARTWQAGDDLPHGFRGLTLDAVGADARRLYVSGLLDTRGALLRSDDGGATWETLDIPGSDANQPPYIAAVDPSHADILYLRTDGDAQDALLVTRDGGRSWQEIFRATSLLGVALSPDGSRIAAGGPEDGLWVASTEDLAFTRRSDARSRCLTWSAEGLFVCGDEGSDGFAVARSEDEGATATPLLRVASLCTAPVACAATVPAVGALCAPAWPATAATLGLDAACQAQAATDAGAQAPTEPLAEPAASASCRVFVRAVAAPQGGFLALLLALLLSRRARRRPSAPSWAHRPATAHSVRARLPEPCPPPRSGS